MSQNVFPVPDATLPFWRTELHSLDSHQSTQHLPSHCDVLIVGAGYSGVATAYHLLDANPLPPSVVILEARETCSGATGRNGGHLKPDVYYNILKYSEKYGAENAAEFARFEAANVAAVKEFVEHKKIDCDFYLTRALDVYLDSGHATEVEGSYQELLRIGAASLGDVQFIANKDAERISGVKDAKCCFSFTAAHIWPYKLILHLLAELIQQGVNLQTNTPVNKISDTVDEDGRWTVSTPRGPIKAKKVLLATNGYTAAIASQFVEKIVPVRGICSRILTPKGRNPPYLSNTYSIRHGRAQYDYLIPRPDGSIIVGGAKQAFWSEKAHWYGVVDDSELIGPAKNYFDGLMQRHFVGWEDSEAFTESVWTGIMGWSSDFMPYIGQVPGKPNQLILAGFSGHGMPLIFLASKEIARMLRDNKTFEETGLPKIFKPTEERLRSKKNDILGT